MRLLLSSVLLGLMWFAAVNAAATLVAWMLGRFILRRSSACGTGLLLAVRLLPALASLVFVLGLFLPAHWRYEPIDSDESFGFVLGVVAAIGFGLVLVAAWRAVRAGLAGYRFAALARRAAILTERGPCESVVLEGLPGVSLAGIWRPRILIGSRVRATLTPEELELAIAHEVAHRRSQDNLKRFVTFTAPDLLGWTTVGRALEERWQAEAEYEADARAVGGDSSRAVLLASALVKVARLGNDGNPHPASSAEIRARAAAWSLQSAFHMPALLEMRVRRLVSGSALSPAGTGRLAWSSATLSVVISACLWLLGLSGALHSVTEAMVTRLP